MSNKRQNALYQERTYRYKTSGHDLIEQTIIQNESDLQIYSNVNVVDKADGHLREIRDLLNAHIEKHPNFEKSLEPITFEQTPKDLHPQVLKMYHAARRAGVGPMAAVAGAVSEYIGQRLFSENESLTDIFIENGGDIYLKTTKERRILVHAGQSPLSEKLAIKIKPEMTPCGICTSSGTVGHSLSFGKADAVVVISKDTCLADATATSLGNLIQEDTDIERGIAVARQIEGIDGVLFIVGDKLGAWGQVELC
ncbi:UPF0280 family protein [Fusibacter sp. JL216-2]|uniref:UPF0280 family protein n=1 Tax=Fusibacter sp. JL216-2 TaxID=3071453 RepID=UPI003D34F361